LLSPGDHVVAISPAYQSLHEIARSIGCALTPWRLEPVEGGWQIDLDRLERAVTPQTRLIVLNFPHNPTGHQISRDELTAIIEIARRNGCYVFSDEMYRLLEPSLEVRLPAVCDVYEKGISLSGLSKSFALPGLRIGWLATQEPGWPERWLTFKDYTTICNSAPSEVLGIIALQNAEAITRRSQEIVRENTALADQFFAAHPDRFKWLPPKGGSIAFPRWLGEGSVEQFCQGVLDRQGVMIVPGSQFDYPGNYFRIGLGRKNFGEGIGKVEEYLFQV
jgi:aspartate/methionine/tyrosine aminotransferase